MEFPTLPLRSRATVLALALWGGLALVACGDGATGPEPVLDDDLPADTLTPIDQLPPTGLSRDDLEPTGNVVETDDGYTVDGELAVATSDTSQVRLANAELRVRFDEQGRVRSISGKAEIASPHERIEIEDPVRADVGFFPGRWLNENRDLGILLREDTDYFIFDFQLQLKMNIATGDTGEDATRPVTVQAPVGGRALMVVDYTDPMYYVFGEQDLLGSVGTGWSLGQRIPFRPDHAVAVQEFGAFDGGAIRKGSMSIFKVFKVSGVVVDNEYTELHMNTEEPLESDLRTGYRQGFNGALEFDLGIRDMVGISLPIASASGGVWGEAAVQGGFSGYAYAAGATADFSWWPDFIPARPVSALDARAYVTSEETFEVGLEGTYGWEFPAGEQSMSGAFTLGNDGMFLEGSVVSGDVEFVVGGHVTEATTRAWFDPPQELLDEIAGQVNDEVLPRIEEAEQAWQDLQEATADYEFELSLRGIRDDLPRWVDEGRARLTDGVNAAIRAQDGKIWEADFRSRIRAADNVYHDQLSQLRAAALNATDNATTRAVLERELREMAARRIFTFRYTYRDPVFGTTLYSTTVTRRILSDTQANRLIEAADNVYRIQETSDRRIRLQDVYDTVNERALFEDVRDDLRDGVLIMRGIDELGFVYVHDDPAFRLYSVIDGTTRQVGTIEGLTMGELLAGLPDIMIEALRAN